MAALIRHNLGERVVVVDSVELWRILWFSPYLLFEYGFITAAVIKNIPCLCRTSRGFCHFITQSGNYFIGMKTQDLPRSRPWPIYEIGSVSLDSPSSVEQSPSKPRKRSYSAEIINIEFYKSSLFCPEAE